MKKISLKFWAVSATKGGGIYNAGSVTLNGVQIGGSSKSVANKANQGGGIYNAGSASAAVNGGSVENNTVLELNGGGIWNNGTLALDGATVSNNSATTSGGGVYNGTKGKLYMAGMLTIQGNKVGSAASNLTLNGGSLARVTRDMDEASRIGVSLTSANITDSITAPPVLPEKPL